MVISSMLMMMFVIIMFYFNWCVKMLVVMVVMSVVCGVDSVCVVFMLVCGSVFGKLYVLYSSFSIGEMIVVFVM